MARNSDIQSLEKVELWLLGLINCVCFIFGAWVAFCMEIYAHYFQGAVNGVIWLVDQVFDAIVRIYTTPTFGATVCAIALPVLVLLIGGTVYFYRPKKKEKTGVRRWLPETASCVFCFVLAFVTTTYFVKENKNFTVVPIGVLCLGILCVNRLLAAIGEVRCKRNSGDFDYFERNKKTVLVITTLTGMAVAWSVFLLPSFFGEMNPWQVPQSELLGYYGALLSLTFISISVMSVLSDRSVIIYWDNVAESKLIKPVFGSFAALTYYSVGAAICAGIAAALGNGLAFLIFSVASIVLLVLLTFSMVDVYYDRDGKKNSCVQELWDDLQDYLWVTDAQANAENVSQEEMDDRYVGYRHYEEKMLLLCQYINRARDEHDMRYLQEVYELFVENLPCFDTSDGRQVARLLYTNCNPENWPLAMRSIRDHLDHMEYAQPLTEDPFAQGGAYRWDQDSLLWQCLMDAPELARWVDKADDDPLDSRELKEFMFLLVRRFVILFNDMVAHGDYTDVVSQAVGEEPSLVRRLFRGGQEDGVVPEPAQGYQRLEALWRGGHISVVTQAGEKPDPAEICQVYEESLGGIMSAATLPSRLLSVMTVALKNMDEDGRHRLQRYLADLPLPNLMMAYENVYLPGSPEMALWQEYFPPVKSGQ